MSWEDDDFEIPDLQVKPTKKNFEDEEDETLKPVPVVISTPSASQLEAMRKKAEDDAKVLANKLQFALQEKETPEERRIRERRQAEEADSELAGELFDAAGHGGQNGNSSSNGSTAALKKSPAPGLAGIKLKNKDDHVNFGILVAARLGDSTSFNISVFLKEVSDRVKGSLTSEGLDDIIDSLQKIRDVKKKAEEPVKTTGKVSKKAIKAKEKKHDDIFGGAANNDRFERYTDLEDDFM